MNPGVRTADWDDLRFFLAAARGRTLSAAARTLAVDGSTVQRRLSALEKNLRTRVFLRTREGLRLSRAGERLMESALKIEAELARAMSTGVDPSDQISGLVRIAATEGLCAFLVERGLCDVQRQHPSLSIELLVGNQPLDLSRDEADLAVRPLRPQGATLKARKLVSLRFGLFASPGYLHARGIPRNEKDLREHDVIVPGAELAGLPEARWLAQRGGRVSVRSNSMVAMIAATRMGAGVSVLPVQWAEREVGLTLLWAIESLPERPLWIVRSEQSNERAAVLTVQRRIERLFGVGAG